MNEILARLCLAGKAVSKIWSCYGAQFYALEIPLKQTIVVTGITWQPFINPFTDNMANFSLGEYLAMNQYQMKFADYKTTHYKHFINSVDMCVLDGTTKYAVADTMDTLLTNIAFLPKKPLYIPLFMVFQDELRIVLTRIFSSTLTGVAGFMSTTTKEPLSPAGVRDIEMTMRIGSSTGRVNYVPGVFPTNSLVDINGGIGNNAEGFYGGTIAAAANETFTPVNLLPQELKNTTQPLFTIHYVLLKENLTGIL